METCTEAAQPRGTEGPRGKPTGSAVARCPVLRKLRSADGARPEQPEGKALSLLYVPTWLPKPSIGGSARNVCARTPSLGRPDTYGSRQSGEKVYGTKHCFTRPTGATASVD